eukprot:TRINITY_DN84752_c0_g1_i1.p1 TRINITY_DN84752_c0_g1~~TRINITY_DN84752_c0_g1_i1.p1  ORF type:complete len:100 (-),score=17.65 TRINITY_DN84752_c0_g1_i1:20-319(-)
MDLFKLGALVHFGGFWKVQAAILQGCVEIDTSTKTFQKCKAPKAEVCANGAWLPNALHQMATFGYEQQAAVRNTATGSSTGLDTINHYLVMFSLSLTHC